MVFGRGFEGNYAPVMLIELEEGIFWMVGPFRGV